MADTLNEYTKDKKSFFWEMNIIVHDEKKLFWMQGFSSCVMIKMVVL